VKPPERKDDVDSDCGDRSGLTIKPSGQAAAVAYRHQTKAECLW
jgi:hypothetical protein